MDHPRIEATPQTVHWGYFDAALPPILTVDPGDTVTLAVTNRLSELTSIHWHGIRVPGAEDGVVVPQDAEHAVVANGSRGGGRS